MPTPFPTAPIARNQPRDGTTSLIHGFRLSDAQMRAGTYLGGPKPPFTPGYELVGIVDELGQAAQGWVWETGSAH